jgi:crossover junction endonuclease EME1
MPDVIDLLSSSPVRSPVLPAPKVTKKADATAASKQAVPSKALDYEATKRKNDDFLILSSDSISSDPFLPPPKPASKPSSTFVQPKSSSNTALKSIGTEKTSNAVFFLSDDFDSTVNLSDDPFASDPPPAKKRRLSPPSKSEIVSRSPEYQRWVSRLEKGTNSGSGAESSKQTVTGAATYDKQPSKSSAPVSNTGSSKDGPPRGSTFKRYSSDIGTSIKSAAPRTSGLKRSKTMSTVLESDPIVFTSSPDPIADARKQKDKHRKQRINLASSNSSDDDIFDFNPSKEAKGKAKSIERVSSGSGNALEDFEFGSSDIDLPDLGAISSRLPTKTTAKSKGTLKSAAMAALDKYEAEKAKEKKQKEKEQKAKDKSAAKEEEKEQKRLAKEEKAREKDRAAELAKVNTLRTDKKKSTLEMIVDLPSCLDKRLKEQIQTFLKPVEAEHSEYESTQPIIKWRRKIDSEFDEQADHWEKVESYIGREKHIMCIMTAKEFVELATGEEGQDLDTHVLQLKAKFSTNEIIYLIEGLGPWMKKNKNLQNRKYVQEVRSQIPEEVPAPTASQKRKKKAELEHVDEDLVEDVLLKLQVVHGVLIHHTKVQIETAEWVIVFTQHISTSRYRYFHRSLVPFAC